MGWSVVLTDRALADLRDIVSFVAYDDPPAAARLGNQLIDEAMKIGNFPKIGRVVPEIGENNVREIIYGSYWINYELLSSPDSVYVLRFWHGARGKPPIYGI